MPWRSSRRPVPSPSQAPAIVSRRKPPLAWRGRSGNFRPSSAFTFPVPDRQIPRCRAEELKPRQFPGLPHCNASLPGAALHPRVSRLTKTSSPPRE